MRFAVVVAWLALVRLAGATCLDDCLTRFGGTGPGYAACVASCGCGNGVLEGDEECDDGNTFPGDCCDATCHFEPAGSACHDASDLCSTGVCDDSGDCDSDDVPSTTCREPIAAGSASLTMHDSNDDAKDLLLWTYRRGQATALADFGTPATNTTYALCVYDTAGLEATITVSPGATCNGHSCWSERAGGLHYRNPGRDPDGAALVILQHSRRDGGTKIVFKASGSNLDLPDLGSLASPVTVQLRQDGSLVCWGAQYSFPPARRNDGAHFRDRSDPPSATSTTTTTSTTMPGTGPTTSSTLPGGATVTVTVLDTSSAPVADADVTISYGGNGQNDTTDSTDDTGVVVFTDQAVGVAAVVSADDGDGHTGEVSSPGFQAGNNTVSVVVR